LAGGSGIEWSPCRRPSSPGKLATNRIAVSALGACGQWTGVDWLTAVKLIGAFLGESSSLPWLI
jgi:hypothetical protein